MFRSHFSFWEREGEVRALPREWPGIDPTGESGGIEDSLVSSFLCVVVVCDRLPKHRKTKEAVVTNLFREGTWIYYTIHQEG